MRIPLLAVSLACALAGTGARIAASGELEVDKNAFFTQTSSSQPAVSTNSQFDAHLVANFLPPPPLGFDVTGASVTPPGGSAIPLTGSFVLILPGSVPYSFSSTAQMDATYPDGSYTFSATSGPLAGSTATVNLPGNGFYPAAVPFLTGSSFANLEHYDPSQPLHLTWNSFGPNALTTSPFVDFFISSKSGPPAGAVFTADTSTNVSSFTSATIPASTLLPNHQYQATLVFTNGVLTPGAAFSGAYDTLGAKSYFTNIFFTTGPQFAPEPGSLVMAVLGAAGLFFVARCRKGR